MASIAYQSDQGATGTTSPCAITKPVSLAVGDLMVVQIIAQAGVGTPAVTPPSGWTSVVNAATGFRRHYVAYKVAEAADVAASSFSFSFDTVSNYRGRISRINQSRAASPVDQSSSGSGTNTTSVSISGITPTKAMGSVFLCMGYEQITGAANPSNSSAQAVATGNPGSWTEAYDESTATGGGNYIGMSMAYGSRPGTTATGSATLTLSTACSNYSAVIFSVAPTELAPITLSAQLPVSNTPYGPMSVGGLTASFGDATFEEVTPMWSNAQKSSTAWSNTPKS